MNYDVIYNYDCISGMKSLPKNSIDCCITDIPYGECNRKSNGLRNLDKQNADVITFNIPSFLDEVVRVTNGSIYIFCGTEQVSEIRKRMVQAGLSTRLLIWEKTNPSPMNGQVIWLSGIECCVYGKFPKAVFNGHCKNTVLRYPCSRNKIHPTQKPIKLIEDLIKTSSNVGGGVILDACMGSGTTAIACINTNRRYIGYEIDKSYYDACMNRIDDYIKTHKTKDKDII